MDDHCLDCSANRHGICAPLEDEIASLLVGRGLKRKYGIGDELIAQGETSDRIGVISKGIVKVCAITEDGDEFVLQLLGPGQIVGDINGSESAFSWDAATSVQICWIPLAVHNSVMRDRPLHHRAVLSMMSQQLADMRHWAAAMRGRSTLQRVAYWLLQQFEGIDVANRPIIRIALTRRDLASFLDMTSETLCRGLSRLSARGAIRLLEVDLIEVSDITKLRHIARCPAPRIGRTLSASDLKLHTTYPLGLANHG